MAGLITRAALAPVLAGPSLGSEQVTQLVLGETAGVLDHAGDWFRVSTHADGYAGWVHSGYLIETDERDTEEWRARASGWSEGALVRYSNQQLWLPLRARVELRDDGLVLPDGRSTKPVSGTVRHLEQVIRAARATAPERWALEHFSGAPYLWGGVTPWGVDCSGLVQTTFAARGVSLPRDSSQQVGCGEPIDLAGVQPGDLLFFRSESGPGITHVAFAGEADTLVHATLACGAVVAESWLPGSRAAGLRERLVAVRRLEPR
jgi:gamma-D-glutamyl-L-lysine dipeptidyl-peptidase